jgi:hypothetical protein
MLNINGNFNQCGLPNQDLPAVSPFTFASVRVDNFLPNSRMGATLEDLISEVRRRLLRCWTWSPSKASRAGSRRFRLGLSPRHLEVNILVIRAAKKLWNDWIRGMCATDSYLLV